MQHYKFALCAAVHVYFAFAVTFYLVYLSYICCLLTLKFYFTLILFYLSFISIFYTYLYIVCVSFRGILSGSKDLIIVFSKLDRQRQVLFVFIYMWNLKNKRI